MAPRNEPSPPTTLRRHARTTVGALIALLSVLGACSDSGYANVMESSAEGTTDTDTDTDGSTTTAPDDPVETTTTTTDVPDTAPTEGPPGSTLFEDPDGEYQLYISPGWLSAHDTVALGIEMWFIDALSGANVNILNQAAGAPDTAAYLKLNVDTLDLQLPGAVLTSSEMTVGSNGQELAMVEFDHDGMSFLQLYEVAGGNATVATFTTDPAGYTSQRDELLPYLLTLTSDS